MSARHLLLDCHMLLPRLLHARSRHHLSGGCRSLIVCVLSLFSDVIAECQTLCTWRVDRSSILRFRLLLARGQIYA